MRAAAVQFAPEFKAPTANRMLAKDLILDAVAAHANLIVLPELCTTGYSFMSAEDARPYAESIDGRQPNAPTFELFRRLSMEHGVGIAWGFLEAAGDKLHNSQLLVLPDGKWVRYRKLNRFGNDFLWATPGRESPPIVEFDGKRVGLLICRDVRDKTAEWDSIYEPGDADVIAFSSNFGAGAFPAVRWVDFATENQVWLVVSNRYGEEENNDFGHGGVCVVSPSGDVHAQGVQFKAPCIVVADIR